ncbi:MAG: hypothetical protein F6K50_07230 [Moorea sp. SIO3I7]|uniref:hypothetical protein n=1 Tax=Moorena sp. SIO3I8 TaxID=2607833 RepID=UPI0013BF3667|nr:hypothetical protein [Moorena sp. SIO3I8]NEN95329.1 hypothetical protein [Moorena sp. SIO3I7]NEO07391.1 hypothetical protein [Moorena sp. SIO3I8]NEP50327.1 hypothetical protein [Moorena sp. SIO3C2]
MEIFLEVSADVSDPSREIRAAFERKCKQDPKYSVTKAAIALGTSTSYLHMLMNGSKKDRKVSLDIILNAQREFNDDFGITYDALLSSLDQAKEKIRQHLEETSCV